MKKYYIGKRISNMLKENTGAHFLDSGGAYGRNWERNQHIKSFAKLPEYSVNIWGGGFTITRNLYHFLVNELSINAQSEQLENRFNKLSKKSENTHFQDIEDFLEELKTNELYEYVTSDNTYNRESSLSQTIQYTIFKWDNTDYILLEIHNGCDVRGGYTKPRIFHLGEWETFVCNMSDLSGFCKVDRIYSDDSGCNWYSDEHERGINKEFITYDDKVFLRKDNKIYEVDFYHTPKDYSLAEYECYEKYILGKDNTVWEIKDDNSTEEIEIEGELQEFLDKARNYEIVKRTVMPIPFEVTA